MVTTTSIPLFEVSQIIDNVERNKQQRVGSFTLTDVIDREIGTECVALGGHPLGAETIRYAVLFPRAERYSESLLGRVRMHALLGPNPATVQFITHDTVLGVPYLVFERGESVAHMMRRGGGGTGLALMMLEQGLERLDYFHNLGAHNECAAKVLGPHYALGDIKPENIIAVFDLGALHDKLQFKFTDVGNVRALSRQPTQKTAAPVYSDLEISPSLVTPAGETDEITDNFARRISSEPTHVSLGVAVDRRHYLAPEQRDAYDSNEKVQTSCAADIYALFSVGFALLTGAPPQPGEFDPRGRGDFPAWTTPFFSKGLRIEPRPSAAELLGDIRRYRKSRTETLLLSGYGHRVELIGITGPGALAEYHVHDPSNGSVHPTLVYTGLEVPSAMQCHYVARFAGIDTLHLNFTDVFHPSQLPHQIDVNLPSLRISHTKV